MLVPQLLLSVLVYGHDNSEYDCYAKDGNAGCLYVAKLNMVLLLYYTHMTLM